MEMSNFLSSQSRAHHLVSCYLKHMCMVILISVLKRNPEGLDKKIAEQKVLERLASIKDQTLVPIIYSQEDFDFAWYYLVDLAGGNDDYIQIFNPDLLKGLNALFTTANYVKLICWQLFTGGKVNYMNPSDKRYTAHYDNAWKHVEQILNHQT